LKNTKSIAFGALLITVVAMLIVGINLQSPVTVQQQTIPTPSGSTTATIKVCDANSPITVSSICLQSKVQGNKTINSADCPNGGISQNGLCPTSVISLPANSTIGSTQTTVPPKPATETIKLSPSVIIIDNSGNNIPLQSSSSLSFTLASLYKSSSQLSFISTQSTNIPIDHGFIVLSLIIQASPNELITANGTLWVSINNNQVNPQGLPWSVNQMTDSSGKVTANILTSTGNNPQYKFDIAQNAALVSQSTNILNFTTSKVTIQNGKGQSYNNAAIQNVYSTTLSYDPNKIIQSSNGNNVIVAPTDDTFTISANAGYVVTTTQVTKCAKGGFPCSTYPVTIAVSTPSILAGSASVYLEGAGGFEKLIGSTSDIKDGTTRYFYDPPPNSGQGYGKYITLSSDSVSNIPRDSDIRIVTTGSQPLNKIIHTPASNQKSFTYACTNTGCTLS
jgi:hypothetical protein